MPNKLTYSNSGVNIDAGNSLVSKIKNIVKSTHRPEVIGNIGGFAGCFRPDFSHYENPTLVAATDGVGTKLKLGIDYDMVDNLGIDLVAMCVNDLAVMGAEPLFFLDYFATGKLDTAQAEAVITGIAKGCSIAKCALLGGETAEMPGMYQDKHFDLAGFVVGMVDAAASIDGSKIEYGDKLVALPSSGVHANGFSLVRNIIKTCDIDVTATIIDDMPLIKNLMQPTAIYSPLLLQLATEKLYAGAAHITGGGFIDNIPRMLPDNLAANIDLKSLNILPIFQYLQEMGNIDNNEMYRVFNCGVGMVLAVKPHHVDNVIAMAKNHNHNAYIMGEIINKTTASVIIE